MGIFGNANKEQDKANAKQTNLSITSSPNLPSKDIIEYITKNDSIPDGIRKRNWWKDYVQISLSEFTEEEARCFLKDVELLERQRVARRQKAPVWTFGQDASKDEEDNMLYNIGLIASVRKATIGDNKTPIVQDALKSSTLVETRQDSNRKQEEQKKRGGLMGLLGI